MSNSVSDNPVGSKVV